MSNKLTYTKAIKNGRLQTAKMEIGSSFQGVVKGIKEGKYGPVYILDIAGQDVDVSPSGNLKSSKDLALGNSLVVTRKEDAQTKSGFAVTQFDISKGAVVNNTSTVSIKDRLQSIRANPGTN